MTSTRNHTSNRTTITVAVLGGAVFPCDAPSHGDRGVVCGGLPGPVSGGLGSRLDGGDGAAAEVRS